MTAAPMTDNERALWVATKQDYGRALAIAVDEWKCATNSDGAPEPTSDTIQAAAATILIHITKLRSEERIHVKIPPTAATSQATGQSSVAVPPGIPSACPACGGKVWDNRENKKNPKAPDWKCRSKECVDEKTGFTTGGWVEKPKGKGANTKPVPAGSYDDMPRALEDDEESALPF